MIKVDLYVKQYLFFVLFAFTCIISFGQNAIVPVLKRCPVKTINFEQGLANNGTTSVVTDALGFTWISSKTGMQRYNGYTLETINPVINNKTININTPVIFFKLQNGLIWISYKQGVLIYNPQTNSFKEIIESLNADNLNFCIIPVKETSGGILCLQYKKGVLLYSPQNGKMLKKIMDDNAFIQRAFNNPDIHINSNFTANDNAIFIYNGSDLFQQVNIKTNEINYIQTENIFCFACTDDKLYTISASSITSINIENRKIEKSIPLKGITGENILYESCFLTEKNQLLIGLNNHLFQFDSACNYIHEFSNLNRNVIVPVGFIRTIYSDAFKRIWLLTNDDIKRVQNFNIPFEHLIYDDEKNNFIRTMYYDEKKPILLAGCYNGGIQLYDTSGKALWQTAVSSSNIKDINGIEKLTDNDYLIVTIARGLYVLNLPSKKLKPLAQLNKNSIDAGNINFCNNIQRINDSTVLIATSSNIYTCIFKKDALISAQPLLPLNKNIFDQLYCFLYAGNKTIWAGTATGKIFRMDSTGNFFTTQIPENYLVRSLAEDAAYHIWAGTDKGLYVYNNSGTLIKTFTTQSGLLNDCIYAISPVKNKAAVFTSSNLGLSYISLNKNIINYTKESGLQENEFNTQSAIKTASGKYYFGGVNGITSFYPSSLVYIQDTPVLNITRLVINDVSYNCSPDFLKGDSLKLNYAQNHIQIDFAALGLLNTNEYVYEYRLTNFETNWQSTHEPRDIKYVLQPGKYSFEITCSSIFSSKEITKRSITIIISPPVWQTWWFKILVASLGIGIIAIIIRQYLNRRYQKKLNALKLSYEIQQERERISRDLHDNLGAYAAAIASNVSTIQSKQNVNNNIILQQLKNNSQFIINQLNDTIWALNKEAISLTSISDRFKIFFHKIQPNYPQITISIQENILNDEKLSPANALHLFRMMQEAVNNALKHSNCSNINIQINSGDTWNIIIKDNGDGFLNAKDNLVKGNGLKNIQSRGGEAGWKITWKNADPKGTEIEIRNA